MTWLSPVVAGGTVGLVFALGVLLIVSRLRAMRVRLDDRLRPYLRRHNTSSSLLVDATRTPFPTLERVLAPVMSDAIAWLDRLGSSRLDVRRRLIRSGSGISVDVYRTEQVVWGFLGLAAGAGLSVVLAAGRGSNPLVLVAFTLICGLAGALLRDVALSSAVTKREQRLSSQLPQVAEMLALAVGAGETPLAAFERIARIGTGDLARELAAVVADTRAGTPLVRALERLANRSAVPALNRFAEAIAIAIERGTPLAEVVRAQAQDCREVSRRQLMELGGRRELVMTVPVVFLVLPVTVLFAIYPGLATLQIAF